MKFILTAFALVLVVSMASAGFLHGGWSAPVYRRVVYSSPSYHGGWSGRSGGGGWSGGYGGNGGWSGGYGGSSGGGYSSYGGSGWNSGWW